LTADEKTEGSGPNGSKTAHLIALSSNPSRVLPLVLHGCETWFSTLREEYRPSVFRNRVLRRIFGPSAAEVKGGWRKLYNVLHNFYSPPGINSMMKPKRMRWARHVARIGAKRNAYRLLVVKSGGKRPL
jgi:hypothetical protein